MHRSLSAAVLFLVFSVAPALAAGPNGGQTTVSEGHPIEFVASGTQVTFYVSDDDGGPLDTAGVTAKAYVAAGGKTETLVLKPAPPNRLVGTLSAPLPKGAKVVMSSKLHGHTLQARFEK